MFKSRETFYTVCFIFGLFWVFVEGYIAYLVYRMYQILKKKND